MKKVLGLVLALSLGVSSCAMAEGIVLTGFGPGLTLIGDSNGDETLRRVLDYASENARYVKTALAAEGRYAPARAYKLEWPEERGSVNQRVATEYVKYDTIVALQYEIESYSSFSAFKYLAVGIDSQGNIEPCVTPDKIISMTYDPNSFKDFRVTVYKMNGIERDCVTVYLPDANYDQLEKFQAEGVNSVAGLIEVLEKAGAVAKGTRVLSYDGNTLDLSEEFGSAVSHTGTAGEYLMMGCVVNTILTNMNLDEITITSVGKAIETGHAVYDEPLKYYESNKG